MIFVELKSSSEVRELLDEDAKGGSISMSISESNQFRGFLMDQIKGVTTLEKLKTF